MTEEVKLAIFALKQEVRCSICLGTLRNPVTTKCFHNFCRECMESLLRTRSSFPCPNCNTPLTKRSLSANDKLSRIVACISEVVQSYNADLANSGTAVGNEKFYLSQSQLFYSSQKRNVPKEEIRIFVDKRFDKDDTDDVEERLESLMVSDKSPEYVLPVVQSTSEKNSDDSQTAIKSKKVVWEKVRKENIKKESEVNPQMDPYDFVPSQLLAPVKVKKQKLRKESQKVQEKRLRVERKIVKKRKSNEQLAKQNEFYENILGSAVPALPSGKSAKREDVPKVFSFKFPKISPFTRLSPRPPSTSPEIVRQIEKGEWKRPPRKKTDIFSDFSSSQMVKMEDLNKEYLNLDQAELNIVEDCQIDNSINDINDVCDNESAPKRRKVDTSLSETDSQWVFCQKEAPFESTQEFVVVSFDANTVVEDVPPLTETESTQISCDREGNEEEKNSNLETNYVVAAQKNCQKSISSFDEISDLQNPMSMTQEDGGQILAPDTDPAADDHLGLSDMVVDTENVQIANKDVNHSVGAWRHLVYEDPDVMKPLLDNLQCTQEVDEFADALKIKIRQERSKNNEKSVEGVPSLAAKAVVQSEKEMSQEIVDDHEHEHGADDPTALVESTNQISIQTNSNSFHLLATLLNVGQWKRIEPLAPVAEISTQSLIPTRQNSVHEIPDIIYPLLSESQQSSIKTKPSVEIFMPIGSLRIPFPTAPTVDEIPTEFFQNFNKAQQNAWKSFEEHVSNKSSDLGATKNLQETVQIYSPKSLPIIHSSVEEISEELFHNSNDVEQKSAEIIEENIVGERRQMAETETFTSTSFSSFVNPTPVPAEQPLTEEIPDEFVRSFNEIQENAEQVERVEKNNLLETIEIFSREHIPQPENVAEEFHKEFLRNSNEIRSDSMEIVSNEPIVAQHGPSSLEEEIPEDFFQNSDEVQQQNSMELQNSNASPGVHIARTSTQYSDEIEFLKEAINRNPIIDCITISPITRPTDSADRCIIERTPSPNFEDNQYDSNGLAAAISSIELTQQKKFVLCFSGFPSAENNRLNEFCIRFGCEYRRKFDTDVTHLVAKTRKINENELCERTMKFFQSMAARIWIINGHWLDECQKHGKLVPVDSYIVVGDMVDGPHNGPEKARTAGSSSGLFQGIFFSCVKPIENFTEIGQLEEILIKCGGELCSSLKCLSQKCASGQAAYIIGQDGEHSAEFYDNLYNSFRVPVLDIEFVLVSLSRYSLAPRFDDFLLCSKHLLEEDFEVSAD